MTKIYCRKTNENRNSFYMNVNGEEYYLFCQNHRKGTYEYFKEGISIDKAMNFSKARGDHALEKTMEKLPAYIKYVEKAYNVPVFNKSKLKMESDKCCGRRISA